MSAPPVIRKLDQISHQAKMEIVSFLQPFFIQKKKAGGGAGAGEHDLLVVIDGLGSVISVGISGDVRIDFNCTIVGWTLLADQSGSIQIDIWKDVYASYPPTLGDTITASAKPKIVTALKNTDTTLTGWTTAITAGDTLRFNVDSVTSIKRVTLALHLEE